MHCKYCKERIKKISTYYYDKYNYVSCKNGVLHEPSSKEERFSKIIREYETIRAV